MSSRRIYAKLTAHSGTEQNLVVPIDSDQVRTGYTFSIGDPPNLNSRLDQIIGLKADVTIDLPPFDKDDHGHYWFAWAHWWDIDHGRSYVAISGGPIFLIGENGKTVDKVWGNRRVA